MDQIVLTQVSSQQKEISMVNNEPYIAAHESQVRFETII